jgi:hypothetical protein
MGPRQRSLDATSSPPSRQGVCSEQQFTLQGWGCNSEVQGVPRVCTKSGFRPQLTHKRVPESLLTVVLNHVWNPRVSYPHLCTPRAQGRIKGSARQTDISIFILQMSKLRVGWGCPSESPSQPGGGRIRAVMIPSSSMALLPPVSLGGARSCQPPAWPPLLFNLE